MPEPTAISASVSHPIAGLAVTRPAETSSLNRRVVAGLIATACGGVLGLASWLTPSPTGLGTHEQLHMPSCGWIAAADLPCPTCGMTTAFAHAADGNLLAAVAAQPLGALLALATAMTLLVCVYIAVTGSRLGFVFKRFLTARAAWIFSGFVIAAWAYKIIVYKQWL